MDFVFFFVIQKINVDLLNVLESRRIKIYKIYWLILSYLLLFVIVDCFKFFFQLMYL